MNTRQLREVLFHLDNQKMTVEELRAMLFIVEEQDRELEPSFSMWKSLEARYKQSLEAGGDPPILEDEEAKSPSFFAVNGRKPVPGKDFNPDAPLCQDDYEYFTGTGQYSDEVAPR